MVLGFPSNNFGGQEPGSNTEIAQFCRVNYDITFPVFAKIAVIGKNANPLFRELAAKTGQPPRWNFLNTCSTGLDSLLPHSKAPAIMRIEGLLHGWRNCSRLRPNTPSL